MTVDQDLVDRVRRRLIADAAEATAENVAAALRVECGLVDGKLVLDVIDHLRSDRRGFGPLDPVLALPGVTDVLVNVRRLEAAAPIEVHRSGAAASSRRTFA